MIAETFDDPLLAFAAVWRRVHEAPPAGFDPDTVMLATADEAGSPSARVVLLRDVDAGGMVFFTNRSSRKGRELAINPRAALCCHWYWLGWQVRIEGPVAAVSDAESDAYFATRPRGSQLGAWASRQSETLADRATLERAVADLDVRFANEVPRPPYWGGYRLSPGRVEFWEEGASRLHDRIVFVRAGTAWQRFRLFP